MVTHIRTIEKTASMNALNDRLTASCPVNGHLKEKNC